VAIWFLKIIRKDGNNGFECILKGLTITKLGWSGIFNKDIKGSPFVKYVDMHIVGKEISKKFRNWKDL